MGGSTALFWILCLIVPAMIGLFVAVTKPAEMVSWINDRSDWWERHYRSMDERTGLLAGVWTVLMWGVHKLHVSTAGIEDEAVKAGLRVGLSFCIAAVSVVLILSLIYIAVAIALVAAGFWVLSRFMEDESAERRRRARARAKRLDEAQDQPATRRDGRSQRRTDKSGNEYTEHIREDGSVAGRSQVKTDWLGNSYVETRNTAGEVVETATVHDGFFETYVEHRNSEGDKVGRSAHRQGWFGDEYIEHKNAEGDETGRSRNRTDREGNDYTEHERRG